MFLDWKNSRCVGEIVVSQRFMTPRAQGAANAQCDANKINYLCKKMRSWFILILQNIDLFRPNLIFDMSELSDL